MSRSDVIDASEAVFWTLDEVVASRAVFVIVSRSDGQAGGNTFGAS